MPKNNIPNSTFIYDEALSSYSIGDTHPMKPIRLSYVAELLQSYGLFNSPKTTMIKPQTASEEDLLAFHTPEYINAVEALNDGNGGAHISTTFQNKPLPFGGFPASRQYR